VNEGVYNGTVQIKSNSSIDPTYNIYLSGYALQDTVGVDDGVIFSGNDIFKMIAMPNPNYGKAIIEFELKSNSQNNVEMFVVDLLGNRISSLVNKTHLPGIYRVELDLHTAKLVSGSYYIIANVADKQLRLPIVILK
jgi:hypothetical protein